MVGTNPDTQDKPYDAVIIGAGPAGVTTATLLAQKGRRVLVLEKERFPRYRIGESLIPYCYFTLERLGMIDKLNASFQKKHSVQFVTPDGKVTAPFYFQKHIDHALAQTWQVERSEFDQMMVDNAKAHGVEFIEGVNVREPLYEDTLRGKRVVGVRAQHEDDAEGQLREHRARVTVDASGRDTLMVKKHDWRMDDPVLKKIAVWTYYKGAKRDPGMDEGATTVAYVPEKGWFWYLPLANDIVSVGVVAERDYLYRNPEELGESRGPEAILNRELACNKWIEDHVSTGEPFGGYRVTGDYSYRSKYSAVDGMILVGDAFAFLDPVFSSGVFLALRGGELAADTIDEALKSGDVTAEAFDAYSETLCQGIEAMRKLVYAFYDDTFSWGELFKKYPELRPDVTDCLIGHVFKDFDKLWSAVEEFANLPAELTYGRPKPTESQAVAPSA